MSKYLQLTLNALVVQYMKKEDLLHVLCKSVMPSTKVVIFDLARTASLVDAETVIYEVLEMLKNGFISSGKYDSTTRFIQPLNVLVFANNEPDRTAMSADRRCIQEINEQAHSQQQDETQTPPRMRV